jgi:hypothetical protein
VLGLSSLVLERQRQSHRPYPSTILNETTTNYKFLEEKDLVAVYELLRDNYVEDDSCKFRFDYSKEFLLWALMHPGYHPEFHLGVISAKSKKLVTFISATPADIRVCSTTINTKVSKTSKDSSSTSNAANSSHEAKKEKKRKWKLRQRELKQNRLLEKTNKEGTMNSL